MTHTDFLNTLLSAGADMRAAQERFESAREIKEKQLALKAKRRKEAEFDNALHNISQLVRLPAK